MTESKALILTELAQFTGSAHWYRHGLVRNVLYTDGARYVAETVGAYWLLDEIALAQKFTQAVRAGEFQVWQLTVSPTSTALTCEDGNGRAVFRKAIAFTDFPPEGVRFYVCNNTIMLPGEY